MAARKPRKSRGSDAGQMLLAAGALLLGGLGAGLVIGVQFRDDLVPEPAPVPAAAAAAVPAPPTARWPSVSPVPVSPVSPVPRIERATEPAAIERPKARQDDPATARVLATIRPPPAPPAGAQLAAYVPPALPSVPAGSPPWMRFAVPAEPAPGRPMIAIVIDDMGLDRHRSARAIDTVAPLTLSFLPYAEDLPRQTAAARQRGHELMVHVPMEPLGFENAGPGVLRTRQSGDEILTQLRHDLDRFDGFVGINNHMGSKFTGDPAGMAVVIGELRRRGLVWLDSRTTSATVGMALARDFQIPTVDRDVFLDHDPAPAAIRRQLAEAEAVARRRGTAIAIGHPRDTTLDALQPWLREVATRGVAIVPLTRIVRARGGAASAVSAAGAAE